MTRWDEVPQAEGNVVDKLVHSPAAVAQVGARWVSYMERYAHLAITIPWLGSYFRPMLPGEICIVNGQTSNGKTLVMHNISSGVAAQIDTSRPVDNEDGEPIVVYVDLENYIEMAMMREVMRGTGKGMTELVIDARSGGRINTEVVFGAGSRTARDPIWRIGVSYETAYLYPQMVLDNIITAVERVRSGVFDGRKKKIVALFFDYLQAIPTADDQNRRWVEVKKCFFAMRYLASTMVSPAFVATQAPATLAPRDPRLQIPGQYDIQESKMVAWRTDRQIAVHMPKTHYAAGTSVTLTSGITFRVEENLMFATVQKQRGPGYPSGATFALRVGFDTGEISQATDILPAMRGAR